MKRYTELVREALAHVPEIFPWDLDERLKSGDAPLVLDVREPEEYAAMRIAGSLNVPRGILEAACDWGYEETVPELVEARGREIVVVCRSGNRSALAARTMQLMGYAHVSSLRTGLKGWNDAELPLVDAEGREVPIEAADEYFAPRVREDQLPPERRPSARAAGGR